MPTYEGKIRSIILGRDPKSDAFRFDINNTRPIVTPAGELTVTLIQKNENDFEYLGQVSYQIYVKKKGSEDEFLWKTLIGIPMMIEYQI